MEPRSMLDGARSETAHRLDRSSAAGGHAACQLLVSVRDADEADIALVGGANIIDIKEPARGSLGRADGDVVAGIATVVGTRAPWTLALGEIEEALDRGAPPPAGAWLAKVGFAGVSDARRAERLFVVAAHLCRPACPLIPAAYADAERASAPPVDALADLAIARAAPYLLLDTWSKDRPIQDWLGVEAIINLAQRLRQAGVGLALAGSLTPAFFQLLPPGVVAIAAVRGSACQAGDRRGRIVAERVRVWSETLRPAAVRLN